MSAHDTPRADRDETDDPEEATRLLRALAQGDGTAADRLYSMVYSQLHSLAASFMSRERADHTLQPTALVHEAYVRLIEQETVPSDWQHFVRIAAQAMRRLLTDHARTRQRLKRGRRWNRVDFTVEVANESEAVDLAEVGDAVDQLERFDARMARVVELRFYAGLSETDVAGVLGLARSTVSQDWKVAKAWLASRLREGHGR